ncbi:MAG: glycosyltransferase [Anaerolineales bacterium]
MTLNIAMLSYHTCPLEALGGKDTGGMNVYVRELTRTLGAMGVHVDVFTRSQNEHVPHIVHDLGHDNHVVHVPAGPEEPRSKSELARYLPQFVAGIQRFAAENNLHYDVIHSHYWLSGLAAEGLAAAWGGTPIVHMFHTLGEMKNRIARNDGEREPLERLRAEHHLVRRVERIIAATPAEEAQLRFLYRAPRERIRVISPGVDIAHFYPIPKAEAKLYLGFPPEERILLFVGRIEPLKGLDTLIRAVSCLSQRHHLGKFCLIIIGGDPEQDAQNVNSEIHRLQRLCDELCLGNLVIFIGKRGQHILPYYYSAAEVVIVPSHYESFGMVALEAMACGTPVIASQVGGLAFLVRDGETGYHVPDGDVQALCERMHFLLTHRDVHERIGLQAAAYARAYDWKNIAEQILEVYREVLQEKERR